MSETTDRLKLVKRCLVVEAYVIAVIFLACLPLLVFTWPVNTWEPFTSF